MAGSEHLNAIMYVHLSVYALEVLLHSMNADIKLLGNLFVGHSVHCQIQHFSFSLCQIILSADFIVVPLAKKNRVSPRFAS